MHRNPFKEMEQWLEEMRDRFEDVAPEQMHEFGRMPADVAETDGEFEVTMDLPGFEHDDIEVRITDRTMHVEAEREEQIEEDEEYIKRERSHRSAVRTIELPAAVREGDAEASYENGVLTVTLPKASEAEEAETIPVA